FRGLAGGRIPWWVLISGWIIFGGLALLILIPVITSAAFELLPALVIASIPLVILWRGTVAKLSTEKHKRWTEETRRLGTELELVASFDLSPLLEHFGSRVAVIRDSQEGEIRTAWLDLGLQNDTLDEAVGHWVSMVEEMSDSLRRLWNACADRCLNTGVQSGRKPHAVPLELCAETMAGAARVRVRVVFTVYALD
ncbi:MAG: hypothetical protein ACKO24_12185, partial [Leptolyngbyaceae cyanobacterium]